jgi:hypothetical protein
VQDLVGSCSTSMSPRVMSDVALTTQAQAERSGRGSHESAERTAVTRRYSEAAAMMPSSVSTRFGAE